MPAVCWSNRPGLPRINCTKHNYAWARPALLTRTLRTLELKAGHKARRGKKGCAHAYNIRKCREKERRFVKQAEAGNAYFMTGWMPRAASPISKTRTGAAN